jgi:hypothetical protein
LGILSTQSSTVTRAMRILQVQKVSGPKSRNRRDMAPE